MKFVESLENKTMHIEYCHNEIIIQPSKGESMGIDRRYLEYFENGKVVVGRNSFGDILNIVIRTEKGE